MKLKMNSVVGLLIRLDVSVLIVCNIIISKKYIGKVVSATLCQST